MRPLRSVSRYFTAVSFRKPRTVALSALIFGILLGWVSTHLITAQLAFVPLHLINGLAVWLGPALTSICILFLFVSLLGACFFFSDDFEHRIKQALGRVSMEVGSVRIKLEDGPARESVVELYESAHRTLSIQYRALLKKSDLDLKYFLLFREIDRIFQTKYAIRLSDCNYRHCLYVPSYTDGDLIQATDYGGTKPGNRKRRGRIFSVRYGIIGKAFRTSRIYINATIGHDAYELAEDWGLTRSEANDQSDVDRKHSMLAIPILDSEIKISNKETRSLSEKDALGVIFVHVLEDSLEASLHSSFEASDNDVELRELQNEILANKAFSDLREEINRLRETTRFDQKAFGYDGA